MSEQPVETLRKALDEIERLRRRCLAVTRFLVFTSIAFLLASFAIFLFRGEVWLGMPFALVALYSLIGGTAINISGTSYTNTQRILRAIEALPREKPRERMGDAGLR